MEDPKVQRWKEALHEEFAGLAGEHLEDGLDLSGSDIVIFPAQSVRFARLTKLCLNNCKKLEEILPLPSSISTFEARECTSLEIFALLSEILTKNSRTNFPMLLRIDLYGCHKLLANMRAIPSWEERHSKEQNWAYPLQERHIDIIFPGKRIPRWFSYHKEAHDSNLCEIDVNRPHHWNDIDEIVFYVVFGFKVGIINPRMDEAHICLEIHDGSDWKDLNNQFMRVYWTDSDHVWMHWMQNYGEQVEVSRFRFECKSELVVFRSVGIHFLKKHELNLEDFPDAQFYAGPNYLSNEIKVLDWPQYPSSCLPSNLRGNNLVDFRMPCILIKDLGGLKFKI